MTSESNKSSPYNDYGNRNTFCGYPGLDAYADQGEYFDMSQEMGYGEQGEYEKEAHYREGPEVGFLSLTSAPPPTLTTHLFPPRPHCPLISLRLRTSSCRGWIRKRGFWRPKGVHGTVVMHKANPSHAETSPTPTTDSYSHFQYS